MCPWPAVAAAQQSKVQQLMQDDVGFMCVAQNCSMPAWLLPADGIARDGCTGLVGSMGLGTSLPMACKP